MTIDVLAFGVVKEIVNGAVVKISANGETVSSLKANLELQYPRLKQLTSFMIAVNGTYAHSDTVINPGDEVAIIPPVSGG